MITINGSGSYTDINDALSFIGVMGEDVTISTDNATEAAFTVPTSINTNGFLLTIESTNNSVITVSGSDSGIICNTPNTDNVKISGFTVTSTSSADAVVIRNSDTKIEVENVTVNHNLSVGNQAFFITNTALLVMSGCDVISDVTFNVETNIFNSCTQIDINDCSFSNSNNGGKDLVSVATTGTLNVTNCIFSGANRDGIRATTVDNVNIERCTFSNLGQSAINHNSAGEDTTIVRNCLFNDNAQENAATVGIVISSALDVRVLFNTFSEGSDYLRNMVATTDATSVTIIGNLYYYTRTTDNAAYGFNGIDLAAGRTLDDITMNYNAYYMVNNGVDYRMGFITQDNTNLLTTGSILYGSFSTWQSESGKDENSMTEIDPEFPLSPPSYVATVAKLVDFYDDTLNNYTNGITRDGLSRQDFYVSVGAFDQDAELGSPAPANDPVRQDEGLRTFFTHDGNNFLVTTYSTLQIAWTNFRTLSYYSISGADNANIDGVYVKRADSDYADPGLPAFYGTRLTSSDWYVNMYNENVIAVNVGNLGASKWVIVDVSDMSGSTGWYQSEVAGSDLDFFTTSKYDYMVDGSVNSADAGTYDGDEAYTGMYPLTVDRLDYDHVCEVNILTTIGTLFASGPASKKGIIEFTLADQLYDGTPTTDDDYAFVDGYPGGYGIWLTGVQNLVFNKFYFQGITYSARIGPDTATNSIRMTNCIFADARDGITTESSDAIAFNNIQVVNCSQPIYVVNSTNIDVVDVTIDFDTESRYALTQGDLSTRQALVQTRVDNFNIACQLSTVQNVVIDNVDFSISSYFNSYDFSGMGDIMKVGTADNLEVIRCKFDGGYENTRYIWIVQAEGQEFGGKNIRIISNHFLPLNNRLQPDQVDNHFTEYITFYSVESAGIIGNYFELEQIPSTVNIDNKRINNAFINLAFESRGIDMYNNYFRAYISDDSFASPPRVNLPTTSDHFRQMAATVLRNNDSGHTYNIGGNVYEIAAAFKTIIDLTGTNIINGKSISGDLNMFQNDVYTTYPTVAEMETIFSAATDWDPSGVFIGDTSGTVGRREVGALNTSLYDSDTLTTDNALLNTGVTSFTSINIDYLYTTDLKGNDISGADPYNAGPVIINATPVQTSPPIALDVDIISVIAQDVDTILDEAPYNQTFPSGVMIPTSADTYVSGEKFIIPEQEKFTLLSLPQGDYKYVYWEIKDSSTGEMFLRSLSVNRTFAFPIGTQEDKWTVRTFDVKATIVGDTTESLERTELITVVQPRPISRVNINESFVFASLSGDNIINLYGQSTANYDRLDWRIEEKNDGSPPVGSPPPENIMVEYNDTEEILGLVYDTPGKYDVELTATNTTDTNVVYLTNYIKSLNNPEAPIVRFTVSRFIHDLGESVTLNNTSLFYDTFSSPPLYTLNWVVTNSRPAQSIVDDTVTYSQDNIIPLINRGDESITFTPTEFGEYNVTLEIINNEDSTVIRNTKKRFFSIVPARNQGTVHILDIANIADTNDPVYKATDIGISLRPTDFTPNVAPGDTILIRGGVYSNLYFQDFEGTEAEPIRIAHPVGERVIVDRSFDPRSGSAGISFRSCHHVYLAGDIYENKTSTTLASHIDWNSEVTGNILNPAEDPTNTQFGFCIRNGNSRGVRISESSTDIYVGGCEIGAIGFAGIEVKQDPAADEPQYWDQYFRMYNIRIGRNIVQNCLGESMYLGFSAWFIKNNIVAQTATHSVKVLRNVPAGLSYTKGDTVSVNVTQGETIYNKPHSLISTKVFYNKMQYSGWDGFQISCALNGTEVHDNKIEYTGQAVVFGQNSGVSLNTINGDFYNNIIHEGTGTNALALYGKIRIYNNTVTNMGIGSRIFYMFYGTDKYEYTEIMDSTIPSPSGYSSELLTSYENDPDIDDDNRGARLEMFHNSFYTKGAPPAINTGTDASVDALDIKDIKYFNNIIYATPEIFLDPDVIEDDDLLASPPVIGTAVDPVKRAALFTSEIGNDNIKSGRLFFLYGNAVTGEAGYDSQTGIPNYNNVDTNVGSWELVENFYFIEEDLNTDNIYDPRFANPYNGDLRLLPDSPAFTGGVKPQTKDVNFNINFDNAGNNRNVLSSDISFGAFADVVWTSEPLVLAPGEELTDLDAWFLTKFPPENTTPVASQVITYIVWSVTNQRWIASTALSKNDISLSEAPDGSGDIIDASTITILSNNVKKDPPISRTSKGTKGEVRYDSTFIYICMSENLWIKTRIVNFNTTS